MPWSGAGNFNLNQDFPADRDAGLPSSIISADKVDNELQNIKAGLENCMTLTGETLPSANIPMNNKKITGLAAATATTDVPQSAQVTSGELTYIGTFAGTATALTGSVSVAPTALTAGMRIRGITASASTGASTLNLNGLGVKDIKQKDGTAIIADDWASGRHIEFEYDGTQWILITNPDDSNYIIISSNDTTPGDIETKVLAGNGITMTTQNDGANETRTIAMTDPRVTFSGNGDKVIKINAGETDYDYLEVGTTADDLVQLNGSAQLPAVDGRNVTEIRPGAIGEFKFWSGLSAPSGSSWSALFCYGQAVSRATYSDLFDVITATTTGDTSSSSDQLTNVASIPDGVQVGTPIEGTNIPTGTTVAGISGTTITLSQNATASGSGVAVRYLPYGAGDGSTTFNIPDARGRSLFGHDEMGGSAASRLTDVGSNVEGNRVGFGGGDQLLQAHTHTGNTGATNSAAIGGGIFFLQSGSNATASSGGGGSENIPPALICNVIIIAS